MGVETEDGGAAGEPMDEVEVLVAGPEPGSWESALKLTPDCLMSSSLARISEVPRERLKLMSHGMRRCSSPFRWKYRASRRSSALWLSSRMFTW